MLRGLPSGRASSTHGRCLNTIVYSRIARTDTIEAQSRKQFGLKQSVRRFRPKFEVNHAKETCFLLLTNFESCRVWFNDLGDFFLKKVNMGVRALPLGRFFLEA